MKILEISKLIANKLNADCETIKIVEKTKGMSNETYIYEYKGDKFSFRIPGTGDELFVIRKQELDIIAQINNCKFTTPTIFVDEKDGTKIAKYIEGKDLAHIGFEKINLEKVASLLKTMHATAVKCNNYEPLERLKWYESHNANLNEEYFILKNQWLNYYNELKTEKLLFCHNDAQMANIIFGNNEYKIIDFEFAGLNEVEYDMASFGNVDFQHALDLGKVYFGSKYNNKIQQRIYMWRIFQCLQWHNVAQKKDEIGLGKQMDIDFNFVANKYLKLAEQLLVELKEIGE